MKFNFNSYGNNKQTIELKYAPSNCAKFCCGDCVIDMKSCGTDYDECTKEGKCLKIIIKEQL